jgi:His-Xaa-Ser system protein HxsD
MTDYLIQVDVSLFDAEVVKQVIYKFADQASFNLKDNQGILDIEVIPKDSVVFDFNQLKSVILDEIIDQDLRKTISQETNDLRNLIIAKAFASADLQ